MPSSKFEANPTLSLRVRRASFFISVFVIIGFLANQLVFVNMVSYLCVSKP